MVEYTEWIEIGNEVYQAKGGTYGENTAVELIEELADFWNRNREELITIGRREARRIIEDQLQV
jgi:hypothetical protein